MNPKLTCSQRQWLHSSVGRASYRYREVTGSSPVEVLNFFQASLRNCKNCDHNCEDHSSFDFISAVHIWFISYASFNIWTQNWPAPNVSGFIAQLVERRTGIARSQVQAMLKSWIFFQASLRNCKNCDHNCEDHSSFDFISAVHIWFISYASFEPHWVWQSLGMLNRDKRWLSLAFCPSNVIKRPGKRRWRRPTHPTLITWNSGRTSLSEGVHLLGARSTLPCFYSTMSASEGVIE